MSDVSARALDGPLTYNFNTHLGGEGETGAPFGIRRRLELAR